MDIFEQAAEWKVEDKMEEVIKNLLTKTSFSLDKIADLTNVSLDFVKEVKKELKNKKK